MMETKLITLTKASRGACWYKHLYITLKIHLNNFIKINQNDLSCIKLVENLENNKKNKHISIKYNFIKDLLNNRTIQIERVNSDFQEADGFTKSP